MNYHLLGKKPASPIRPSDLHFKTYRLSAPTLPPVPARFGFTRLKERPWGMLGNDSLGDCVIAGSMHATELQAQLVGKDVEFTDSNALQVYSEATGYNPADPSTDQGTDMLAFGDYWTNTGLLDAAGNRHKLIAYLRVDHMNLSELLEALFIFKVVHIGIQFPQSAMDQTNNNEVWDVVPGSPLIGGHCVELVSRYNAVNCVTWGAPQAITEAFLSTYLDEAFVPISEDMLNSGLVDSNGYDVATLRADAAQLAGV